MGHDSLTTKQKRKAVTIEVIADEDDIKDRQRIGLTKDQPIIIKNDTPSNDEVHQRSQDLVNETKSKKKPKRFKKQTNNLRIRRKHARTPKGVSKSIRALQDKL